MNSKQVKKLRQDMRDMGFDPSETNYDEGNAPVYMKYNLNEEGQPVFTDQGVFVMKMQKGKPRTLLPCGRKLYKDMKEWMRIGEVM